MDVRTYRARSVQEALALVRRELGPDAAVLHTRAVSGLLGLGARQVEVFATSDEVDIPSRFADEPAAADEPVALDEEPLEIVPPPRPMTRPRRAADPRLQFRLDLLASASGGVELSLDPQSHSVWQRLFHDLVAAQWTECLASEFLNRILQHALAGESDNELLLRAHLAGQIECELPACRPIAVAPGARRVVALVGPTGVGKTTTLAKLAAGFRLRQQRRVGLITVDTQRLGAVDQLGRYANWLDLPMEVVATPGEMRAAMRRLADRDLILIDTAGRSPRDAIQLRELQAVLAPAEAHEIHLVMSSTASGATLIKTAELFEPLGTSSLVLTKLDEAPGLGHLLPLLRHGRLPVSYLTDGQHVPDDIMPAQRALVARVLAGLGLQQQPA